MTTSPEEPGRRDLIDSALTRSGATDPDQRTMLTQAMGFVVDELDRRDRAMQQQLQQSQQQLQRSQQQGLRRLATGVVAGGVGVGTVASSQGQEALVATGDAIGRGVTWTGGQIADGAAWAGEQASNAAAWAGEQASNAAEWAGRQWDTGTAWVGQQYNDAVEWASRVGNEALDWAQQTGANVGNWIVQTGSDIGQGAASVANNAWQMVADYGQHIAANPGQTATTAAIVGGAVALTNPAVRQAVATAASAGNRWMHNAAAAVRHPAESTRKMLAAISANPRVQSALRSVGITPRQTTQAASRVATGEARTAGEQGRTGGGTNFANDPAMAPASGATGGQTGQAAQTGDAGQRQSGPRHAADKQRPDTTRGV